MLEPERGQMPNRRPRSSQSWPEPSSVISEGVEGAHFDFRVAEEAAFDAAGETPIIPGQVTSTVRLTVVFGIGALKDSPAPTLGPHTHLAIGSVGLRRSPSPGRLV